MEINQNDIVLDKKGKYYIALENNNKIGFYRMFDFKLCAVDPVKRYYIPSEYNLSVFFNSSSLQDLEYFIIEYKRREECK